MRSNYELVAAMVPKPNNIWHRIIFLGLSLCHRRRIHFTGSVFPIESQASDDDDQV